MKLLLLVALAAGHAVAAGFDHAPWDRVLQARVNALGEVDYKGLKANRQDLDEYVRRLAEASPVSQPQRFRKREEQLAYWINAYNAFVMRGVIDRYPTDSVRSLGFAYGFFRRKDYTAGGAKISLLDLEDDILRKQYKDPRIHFAIVCASISCPFLWREAFVGDKLEEQLEQAARAFVNQKRNLTINAAANEITLGAVYGLRDYEQDFQVVAGPGGTRGTLLDYVRRYASEDHRKRLDGLKRPRIKFYEYDWSINEVGSRAKAKAPLERELAQSLARKR